MCKCDDPFPFSKSELRWWYFEIGWTSLKWRWKCEIATASQFQNQGMDPHIFVMKSIRKFNLLGKVKILLAFGK